VQAEVERRIEAAESPAEHGTLDERWRAVARADEIIAAFDGWWKKRKPARGFKKAERARNRAMNIAHKIGWQVAQTPAHTLEGFRAKIRCALAFDCADSMDESTALLSTAACRQI
jgi:hypothetical protein